VILSGTAEANSTVTVFDAGALLGTAKTNSGGSWSYTTNPLSDGPHAFTAAASDVAGNTSPVSPLYDPIIGGTTIEANGVISLIQAGNKYYFDDGTANVPPLLKFFGAACVVNFWNAAYPGMGWAPIGVEKTASGYEVAWKDASGDYTAWNTDNNGNYISNIGNMGWVSGTSTAFESLESSFNQDLNKDGYIGLVLNGSSGGQTLTATSSPTALIGGPNDILSGGAGADTFVFPTNFGSNTVKNFTPGTDALQFSQAMFADVAAVLSDAQQVGSNVVITHDPQNVVTLQNMQLTNLHASDIHIV
jgi:hypothetical protein